MARHSTIPDLARALRDHLIAYFPEGEEIDALKALGDEIAIALLRRRPSPRYAIGIDHGTPEGSKGVVGLFKNGVLVWKDEPGDVDDGPLASDIDMRCGLCGCVVSRPREDDCHRIMDSHQSEKHPGITSQWRTWTVKPSSPGAPHADCTKNPCAMCKALRRMLTPAELRARDAGLDWAHARDVTHEDDELDEEERGVPTPWSSTWDG